MRKERGSIGDEKRGRIESLEENKGNGGRGEKIENLGRRRESKVHTVNENGTDFLLSINLMNNKAAANDANEFLVDEYGHNNTLVHRWSCIWSLSTGHTLTLTDAYT